MHESRGEDFLQWTERKLVGVSQSLGLDASSHRTVTVSELCRIVVPAPWSAPLPVLS